MLLISNVLLRHDFDFTDIKSLCAELLKTDESNITGARLYRRSVDARKKSCVRFCCSFLVDVIDESSVVKNCKNTGIYKKKEYTLSEEKIKSDKKIVIAGFGPAGIFAALTLSKRGLCPTVLELGKCVDGRKADIAEFTKRGKLNPQSNVLFGEGGAGTFSDGKLTTGIKDVRCKTVIRTLFENGANEDILFDAKPHIGTDMLPDIIKNIRRNIESLGANVLFNHKLTKINVKNGRVCSVSAETPEGTKEFQCDYLILAVGHSARDTFFMLNNMGVTITQKPFSVGARIEHPQSLINRSQLGEFCKYKEFTPADYKLFTHLKSGRGVYTFCMCPGGSVINSSSEPGGIVTNGMSNNKRDGKNANSALLVSVGPEDFGSSPLDGIYFQQKIERTAFKLSGSYAPIAQRVGDFLGVKSDSNDINVAPSVGKVTYCSLDKVFPRFITDSMREGIKIFDKKLSGFGYSGALLTAPETRSSSPIRIVRNENFESSLSGLIPCGEGAGYAGGIVSAAVDGIRCAESVIERINL